jgi:hypothetical protein
MTDMRFLKAIPALVKALFPAMTGSSWHQFLRASIAAAEQARLLDSKRRLELSA